MSDLDDKLRQILNRDIPDNDAQEQSLVDDIKQAFAEEGYIKEIDVSMPAITPYNPKPIYIRPIDHLLDFGNLKPIEVNHKINEIIVALNILIAIEMRENE